MTQTPVNIGTGPNTGSGDSLRDAFTKLNANFADHEARLNALVIAGNLYQPLSARLTALTNGKIDNAIIGGTTPAAGSFTSLTLGAATVTGVGTTAGTLAAGNDSRILGAVQAGSAASLASLTLGTPLPLTQGGTGATTALGSLTSLGLSGGTTGYVLTSNGSGAAPTFQAAPPGAGAVRNDAAQNPTATQAAQAQANVGVDNAETSVASAATTDIGATATQSVVITGTTAIASFGTGAKRVRIIRFAGVLTLTYNATSLILPTPNLNITTAAGDTCIATSDASGNWRVRHYQRADGTGVVRPAGISLTFSASDFAPSGSSNVWGDYATVDFVAAGPTLKADLQAEFYNQGGGAVNLQGRLMLRVVTGGVTDVTASQPQGITVPNNNNGGGIGGNVKPSGVWTGLIPGSTYRLAAQFLRQANVGPIAINGGAITGISN